MFSCLPFRQSGRAPIGGLLVVLGSLLACKSGPDPERVCSHLEAFKETPDGSRKQRCVSEQTELRRSSPEVYRCAAECILDTQVWSELADCEPDCRRKLGPGPSPAAVASIRQLVQDCSGAAPGLARVERCLPACDRIDDPDVIDSGERLLMRGACQQAELAWSYCKDAVTLPPRLDECRKMCAIAEEHRGAAELLNARHVCGKLRSP